MILFICSCNSQQSERMAGFVVKIDNNLILVVQDGQQTWVNNQPRAMNLSITPDTKTLGGTEFKIGMYVEVETKGNIAQSYPEQAVAKTIKIIQEPNQNVKLSRSQAIEKVINQLKKTDSKEIIIVNVEFLKESNEWKVETMNLLDKSNPQTTYVNIDTGDLRESVK